MPDYLMGIDLGSTSLKSVVFDLEGRMVARASRPTVQFHPNPQHPEWTVWQPEQIWGDTAAAIRETVSQLDDPRQIRAVAVTGMGMDGLPVDSSGQWLYPFISWHDARTLPQYERWLGRVGLQKSFLIGGSPVWPINSVFRILWMAENEPEIMQKTAKWLLIEDFVNFMLCGKMTTDYSMASCTLLFDQRRRCWSDELLAAAGLSRSLLCELQPSGTFLGEIHGAASRQTGLPEGTPVVLGGHDHLCGAIPVGAFEPGVFLDVTGTWETVLATTDEPALDAKLVGTGLMVQAHVARDKYTAWGGNPAGDMLEWFRAEFGESFRPERTVPEPSQGMDSSDLPSSNGSEAGDIRAVAWEALIRSAAKTPPGARGVLFLPHLCGASFPVVDATSRGAFLGLSRRAGRGEIVRAIIEGLCFQFRDFVETLAARLGRAPERVITVGGATRNRFWMQTKADVLGRAVEVPEIEEATPLGAAILAGIGVGLYADERNAYERVCPQSHVYHPQSANQQLYDRTFAIYRQLYPLLADLNRKLAENE